MLEEQEQLHTKINVATKILETGTAMFDIDPKSAILIWQVLFLYIFLYLY